MAHKYPLTKPMLLLNADVELEQKNIIVKMHMQGSEFLKAKKTDKELEKVLKNLFGIDYKIELIEDISKEELKAIKENMKKQEAKIIAHIEEENRKNRVEKEQEETAQYTPVPEYNDVDYMPPTDLEGYIPEEEEMLDLPPEEENYIMGKPSRAKEKLVKIKDITANDGRVTLEGRVISSSARETKSGKGMIIVELYDGTGTITCKSFAKDIKEGNEIVEKIERAKAIKLIGKAGLDTFAGDVTVICNTIIETDSEVPELPEEDDSTPLILGTSQNITDPLVKIVDLGVDDGKIALHGEVIFTEEKTLKSGKTLFSFDLYDGTSSITCKAFLNKETAKKTMKRISGSKGLKISGTAQMY